MFSTITNLNESEQAKSTPSVKKKIQILLPLFSNISVFYILLVLFNHSSYFKKIKKN